MSGTGNWTGSVVVSVGNIKRASGGYADRSATKNLGLIITRGEMSADDLVTSKKLLEG